MYMRIVILLIENMYIDLSLSLCYNYSATFFKHLLLIKISYNEIILQDDTAQYGDIGKGKPLD